MIKTDVLPKIEKLSVVKIIATKHKPDNKFIGTYAVDITSHYYGDIAKAQEIVLAPILSKYLVISFDKGDVTTEETGYFNYESIEDVKLNTIRAMQEYPNLKIPENTGKNVLIAGNVTRMSELRFIQLSDKFLFGYTSIAKSDEQSQSNRPFSELYYFFKIGEYDGTPIFRYASDMVVSDEREEVDWVLGVGRFGFRPVIEFEPIEQTRIKHKQF